jgi:hypothetical protein
VRRSLNSCQHHQQRTIAGAPSSAKALNSKLTSGMLPVDSVKRQTSSATSIPVHCSTPS